MFPALLAVLVAVAAAGWLLFRLAGNDESRGERPMTVLKVVVWLALTAALLAAKLWPLAFMVLIAAGGVAACSKVDDKADSASNRLARQVRNIRIPLFCFTR